MPFVVSNHVSISGFVEWGYSATAPFLGKVFDSYGLLKITLRVPHILSVKFPLHGTPSGPGAFFDFSFLIANTTSYFVITQSIVSCWVFSVAWDN